MNARPDPEGLTPMASSEGGSENSCQDYQCYQPANKHRKRIEQPNALILNARQSILCKDNFYRQAPPPAPDTSRLTSKARAPQFLSEDDKVQGSEQPSYRHNAKDTADQFPIGVRHSCLLQAQRIQETEY